ADAEDGDSCQRKMTLGINWTPALPGSNPFYSLSDMLGEQRVDADDPVWLIVHVSCPLMRSTDRGKSRYTLPDEIDEALRQCVKSVTKKWKAAKLREERVGSEERKRMLREDRSDKKSLMDAAYEVMEQAYLVVSDNGTLPANARQIMYVARPLIIELAGKFWKHSASFTQGALP